MTAARRLLRLQVQGLQIDAECGEGGVIHLSVCTDQQHQGMLGRLRQYAANALWRAGNLCNPGHHHDALRVVELVVPSASIDDAQAWIGQCHVFQRRPSHTADGHTHYEALVVHEGIESHQQRLAAFRQFFRGGRQWRADDAHGSVDSRGAVVEVTP